MVTCVSNRIAGDPVSGSGDGLAKGGSYRHELAFDGLVSGDGEGVNGEVILQGDDRFADARALGTARLRISLRRVDRVVTEDEDLRHLLEGRLEVVGPHGGPPEIGLAIRPARAAALGHAADLGEWRRRPAGDVPILTNVDEDHARAIVAERLAHSPDGEWLDPRSPDTVTLGERATLAP